MTPLRRERLLWAACILGLILSCVLLLPRVNGTVDIRPPNALTPPHSDFPIHPPRPRETDVLFSRPFLFELASSDKLTGREREDRLMERYQEALERLDNGKFPKVAVDSHLGISTVTLDGQPFATVLPQDCPDYYARLSDDKKRQLEDEVAYAWANLIQDDLMFQLAKRHPVYLQLYNFLAVMLFFLTGMVHLTLSWIGRRLFRSPMWSAKLLLWVIYGTTVATLHPSLDDLANLLSEGALSPTFYFLLCGAGAELAHQLAQLSIRRYFQALADIEGQDSTRTQYRRHTLQQAWTFLSRVGWSFLALCLYLYLLGVDLTSFFAGAGLIGVAIGVMARDVFLDFFNGAYILAEDQFVVGDWIETDNDGGKVEAFSLRSTKIRRTDGCLAILPNSDLRRVRNHSNEWSMVDYRLTIAYESDTELALALIMEELALLDTEWQGNIDGPPEMMGVQELNIQGVVLRVRIKTVPLAQWETQRRLNRRLLARFQKEGIRLAQSSRVLYLEGDRPFPVTLQSASPWLVQLDTSEPSPPGRAG